MSPFDLGHFIGLAIGSALWLALLFGLAFWLLNFISLCLLGPAYLVAKLLRVLR